MNVTECRSGTFDMLLFWSNGTFEVYEIILIYILYFMEEMIPLIR